ncbi:MAG: hypothetical protein KGZ58_03825 [Ignavibacteriales bacterium]|nr:hypothetical protein [Ignavibacteriales bacterium]
MKLTKSQYNILAEIAKDSSAILFGALVASIIFAKEPIAPISIFIGLAIYLVSIILTLTFKKKGNDNG